MLVVIRVLSQGTLDGDQPGKSGVKRAAPILMMLVVIRVLWMVTNLVKVA